MKLKYQNKEIELFECRSFFQRFRGFMFCTNIHHALLFKRCNSIHTFFMKEAIDVVFCDDNNVILYYYKNLEPNKIIWPRKKATRVYELPSNYFDIKISDRLEII